MASRRHGVIVWEQLVALGLTRGAIAHRVQRGMLRRLYRGVYLCGGREPDLCGRGMAVVLACGPNALMSHGIAGAQWDVRPAFDGPPDVTTVGDRARIAGVRTHEVRQLHHTDRTILNGIPITSVARTLVDIAAELPTHELAATLERAQTKRLVTKDQIEAALDRAPRRAGTPALRALIAEPAFTRSKAERILVKLLRAAKLPRPAFNAPIEGFEVDAVWRPERVVLEFDSYAFHATRAAFERDRRRDAILTRAGYVVLRTTWRELTEEPHALVARVAEALAIAGRAVSPSGHRER